LLLLNVCCHPKNSQVFFAICFPMLFIDWFFYNMALHDGILVLLVAKSGNGSLLFLAAASWIPSYIWYWWCSWWSEQASTLNCFPECQITAIFWQLQQSY
jgi:hypothetical protein